MAYVRRASRKPRAIEQSDAMRERDELRISVALLRDESRSMKSELVIRRLEVEKLLDDKIKLARELREARMAIDFLKGRPQYDLTHGVN